MSTLQIAGLVLVALTLVLVTTLVALVLKERADAKAAAAKANALPAQMQVIEKALRRLELENKGRTWSRTDDEDYAQLLRERNRVQIRMRKQAEMDEQMQLA